MYQPPYSVLKPLRYMVGGPSEVYASSRAAVFCAGMNPPSLKDLLRGCLLVAFFENPPVLPWTLRVFRKPTSPPLPLREGPPLISVFSPQGKRGNRSSSSLWTASLYGWRTIRGLRQQQSCVFLCGDEPAFTQGFAKGLLARCFFRNLPVLPWTLSFF